MGGAPQFLWTDEAMRATGLHPLAGFSVSVALANSVGLACVRARLPITVNALWHWPEVLYVSGVGGRRVTGDCRVSGTLWLPPGFAPPDNTKVKVPGYVQRVELTCFMAWRVQDWQRHYGLAGASWGWFVEAMGRGGGRPKMTLRPLVEMEPLLHLALVASREE